MGRRFRGKKIPISYFHCPDCRNTIPLPRIHGQREKGHIKDLFCPYCDCIQKMTEERFFDHFEEEDIQDSEEPA